MNTGDKDFREEVRLLSQDEDLQRRLEEAEQTLEAIRHGDVDAIVVAGPRGDLIYSLTGAEHAYRVIVETMNEAALTVDLDGTILFSNQRFCDLMRTPLCEVVGLKVADFAAEPQRPVLEAMMAQAQAGPVQRHLVFRAVDGTAVPVLLSASLLQTTDSTSICLVASDLTELEDSANSIRVLREHQEALQESEERYRRLFMDDLTGDFIATAEGRIIECNPAFVEIYGFEDPADAVERGDISQFNRKDWAGVVADVRRWGKVQRYEGKHHCFDGREIYVVANVVGQFDEAGEFTGIKGYVFDDTERKLGEMALQETNTRLEEQREDLIVVNEQLLTQQEELRRQAEELVDANATLRELKEQAERTAREMEQLGRMTRENPDPVFRISLDHQILYLNESAEELCRRWNCDRKGIPPVVRDLISASWMRSEPQRQESEIYGSTYLLSVTSFLIDGYANLYVRDITRRKKAEEELRESEEKYRRLFDSIDEGFCIVEMIFDAEGRPVDYRFLEVNPAFESQTGLHDARGKSMRELAPAHEAHWFETYGRIATTGEPARFVNEAKALHRWYDVYAFRVDDAESRRVAILFNDITQQRRVEESLRDLTRTLETRVVDRTQELEYRARQLQKLALELSQAEEQERRRLAEILHDDLQQQLAAVKFHLGIMGGRTKDDAGVQRSIAQLDKMLRDAIETSRSLSHELSPAVMYHGDLGEVFEWLANQIRLKHGLIVHVDAHDEIDTESDALKAFLYKAVQEMLFNAVKHARVREAVVRVRRRGRYISLCVSDKGRGFDPQDLRKTTGFGLMSIRERIGLLGGRMRIHSVKGEGSRFIISVPDGQAVGATPRGCPPGEGAAGDLSATNEGRHGGLPLRVLIADDHEIVRQGLASLLAEAKDMELVGEAGNGREAVDLVYQLRPDVVILDVAMPLMNGDEAARQIRRHLPETRIVALSMYDEAGAVEKMRKAGAESYVLKTAPSEELLAAVRGRTA